MAITYTHEISNGILYVQQRDGTAPPHRTPYMPGSDLSAAPDDARAAAESLWTPQFVADWQAQHNPPPPEPGPDELRAAADAIRDRIKREGMPYGELHIGMEDGARADMGGMALTATLAGTGAVPWPEGYSRGWISVENERIPMPSPADGIALASAVGDFYSRLSQRNRDVKDAVIAGQVTDLAAVEAAFADVTEPWSPTP